MMNQATTGTNSWLSIGLLAARFIAGGALLFASIMKLQGGPLALALGIQSFELTPVWAIMPLAYLFPMLEFILGAALVLGAWTREAGALSALLYLVFTGALASVLVRGMDVDCGCFGGFFGETTVTWFSILRNTVFIAASVLPACLGGGKFALDAKLAFREQPKTPAPAAEPESG